jgi:hypothetical protein
MTTPGSSPQERLRFIEHKGHAIYLIDFSHCAAKELLLRGNSTHFFSLGRPTGLLAGLAGASPTLPNSSGTILCASSSRR